MLMCHIFLLLCHSSLSCTCYQSLHCDCDICLIFENFISDRDQKMICLSWDPSVSSKLFSNNISALKYTNTQKTKELKITPLLDKLLEYKTNWIQHVNRMPRNRLPKVMKHYSPTGGRNYGRPLKRLLDTWDRNGSTGGPTPWQIYDDDMMMMMK